MKKQIYILLISFLLPFCVFSQKKWYVNGALSNTNNNGSSWENAFTDLQSALKISQHGDTILVAKGIYYPSKVKNRARSFVLKNGVRLFGGFVGNETTLNKRDYERNETILSGDSGIVGDTTDNAYNVVYVENADSTTIINGFTITGGYATNPDNSNGLEVPSRCGGGGYVKDSQVRIENIRFIGNVATTAGAGLSIFGGSSKANVSNCLFQNNRSELLGGAIYLSYISSSFIDNCHFISNWARASAGAIYYWEVSGSHHLMNSSFYGNDIKLDSPGIRYSSGQSNVNVYIYKCHFENQGRLSAEGTYSALLIWYAVKSNFFINQCGFIKNRGGAIGVFDIRGCIINVKNTVFDRNLDGAMSVANTNNTVDTINEIQMLNCVFNNNNTYNELKSKTIDFHWICRPINILIANCSFYADSGDSPREFERGISTILKVTDAVKVRIVNSILYEARGTRIGDILGALGDSSNPLPWLAYQLNYSLVGRGIKNCENDFFGRPLVLCNESVLFEEALAYKDPENGDFTLRKCSSAIDAGDNSILDSLGITTDILGNPRVVGGKVDLGAFEYNEEKCTTANEDILKQEIGVFVYPNPANESIHLSFEQNTDFLNAHFFNIKIIDMMGKIVKNMELQALDSTGISTQELNSGIYYLKVDAKDESWSKTVKIAIVR